MSAVVPRYVKQPGGVSNGPAGDHILSDAEYAAFLLLMPYAGLEPLIDTAHDLVVDSNGNILYGAPT